MKLLISEPPLQVLPSLAVAVGLNEALFLQQLHYWAENPHVGKEHDGRKWVRNTIDEWRETNFPFWSKRTIERLIEKLKKKGYLLHLPLGKHPFDRANYYSIDYDKLGETMPPGWREPSRQSGAMQSVTSARSLTETTTETTTEKKVTVTKAKNGGKRSRPFPLEKLTLDDDLRAYCASAAPHIDASRFMAYFKTAVAPGKGYAYKNYRTAFQRWIEKEEKYYARSSYRKASAGKQGIYATRTFAEHSYGLPRSQTGGKNLLEGGIGHGKA